MTATRPAAAPSAAPPPAASQSSAAPEADDDGPASGAELKAKVDAYERGLIVAALERHNGNRTYAARALGLSRATLHTKLNKYGLAKSDTDLDS
jgi:two-component system response regulator HydG